MPSKTFVRFYNCIAIGTGTTSFNYNAMTGEHIQRLWTQVLAIVANVCTIISLPWIFWNAIERTAAIQWNPMMTYSMYMTYTVRTLVIVYTILNRVKIDLINSKVLRKYHRLKSIYLNHLPRVAVIEGRMNRLFYGKYLLMSLLLGGTALQFVLTEVTEWNLMTALVFVMVLQTTAVLQLTIFNYFWFLWLICYSLKYVKWHFRHLIVEVGEALRQGKHWRLRMLAPDVRRILEVHWQLAELARIVNLNYRFLILAVLMERTTSLVLQIYYGAIFMFDHRTKTYLLIIGSVYFCSMVFDMYLIFLICDITVSTYYASVYKLRRVAELNSKYTALKQLVEKFFLRVHTKDFRLDLCGLMLINKETWLGLMQHVAYDSLTLIQFHVIWNANKNFS